MARCKPTGNTGFVLLVVIVVMLLISFLALQLIFQVRTELKIAGNRAAHFSERMLAEGGVSLALFRLNAKLDLDTEELLGGPFSFGKIYESVFPAGKIEYYAVSESGKIDLNSGSMVPLMLFLEHLGLDEDERAVVADSLLDWRDGDDLYRVNGAERDYYEELPRPYVPRNAKIEDPGEFFLIRGTERLRGMFDPYEVFTTHGAQGKINFNSLTPAMLDFLTAGNQEDKDLYWELRQDIRTLSGAHAQQVLGSERYAMFNNILVYNVPNNPYYSIVARGLAGFTSEEGAADEVIDEGLAGEGQKKKRGGRVRVLVSSNGGRIRYLSWRVYYS
ncbi:MAG: general secretion pathway protein GspK [Proteobacteria bacterium]|nr:general secretion pathway protein GspK [Pseudomonadota bacterium]MBU1737286.1 general secretion pathway protein GspK [Pseudomonadota bacterium]